MSPVEHQLDLGSAYCSKCLVRCTGVSVYSDHDSLQYPPASEAMQTSVLSSEGSTLSKGYTENQRSGPAVALDCAWPQLHSMSGCCYA